MNKFFVVSSAACMPNSCWGVYKHVAVLETDGTVPRRIDSRPKYVKRIVKVWRKLNVGTSDKCAYAIALSEAKSLCEKLNQEPFILAYQRHNS